MDSYTKKIIKYLNRNFDLDITTISAGYTSTTNMCPITQSLKETGKFIQVSTYLDRIITVTLDLEIKVVRNPKYVQEWIMRCDLGKYPQIGIDLPWDDEVSSSDNPTTC